jgi:hypothetical protein
MKPAHKLNYILGVLHEKDKYRSFTECTIGLFTTEGTMSKFNIKNLYRKEDWDLLEIRLTPQLVGERVNYSLQLNFLSKLISKYYTNLEVYLKKGESQLRVYRYYTESQFYGFTIEIKPTSNSFLWLIFYPIQPEILTTIENTIGETIPIQEVSAEIEIPFKSFINI